MAKRGLPDENNAGFVAPSAGAAPQPFDDAQAADSYYGDAGYVAPPPLPSAPPEPLAAPAAAGLSVAARSADESYAYAAPLDEAPGDELNDFVTAATEGDDEAPVPAQPRRRRASDIILLILAILLMGGGAVFGVMAWQKSHAETTYPDMANHKVVPDDPSALDPAFLEQADAVADVGDHFIITSVGLDVPLGEVNEVNGVMNPPGFTSAYRVRNRGVTLDNASNGTVYVIAHSLRSPGVAPGNYVINVAAGTVIVANGALIQVGDRTYQVTSSEIVSKTELGAQTELWANTPGMLVFVTCLQYPNAADYQGQGHSRDNAVIIGQLVS